MRLFTAFICGVALLSAQRAAYISPGHPADQLSRDGRAAQEIGRVFLANSAGLSTADLSGVYLATEFKSANNGVTHLRYLSLIHI